ncbi:hypothetical protein B0H11DRAFT_2206218 [Mycena galericulata]|nr:hypothetical protein B0H11DRAFT_2206218 [Mycena galericulata]
MSAPLSTKEILARAKRKRLEQQNAAPPPLQLSVPSSPVFPATPGLVPLPALNLDPASSPFSTSPALTANTLNIRGTSMAQLKNFGERELKRAKLDAATETDFRTYLTINSKDERDAMQALWTLQVRDQINKLTQDTTESWSPTNALEKASRRFIYSFLLLPNIQLYAGTLVDALLLAMRAVGTSDLPNADSIHVDELNSWLGDEVSQARYAIKKKIGENIDLNVAELAAELVSQVHAQHVPATLGLYMRLALIRRNITLKHNPNKFWGKVDEELESFRAEGSQAFIDSIQVLYEDDIAQYGDPSATDHVVQSFSDPNFTCPRWLRELYIVAPKKSKNKKRKRVVVSDDNEENPGDVANENEHMDREGSGGGGSSGSTSGGGDRD